jgi:hypothetical protein
MDLQQTNLLALRKNKRIPLVNTVIKDDLIESNEVYYYKMKLLTFNQ